MAGDQQSEVNIYEVCVVLKDGTKRKCNTKYPFFKLQYVFIIDFIQKGAYQSYKSVKFYVDQQTLRSTQLAVLA